MITKNINTILQTVPKKNCYNEPITLLAVTKKQSIVAMQQAIAVGITAIAENTVQEFLQKYAQFYHTNPSSQQTQENIQTIQWHFIGKLQRNKVKYLVHKIDLLHSLDSITLAEEIERQGQKHNWYCPSLIQVNIANEQTKSGFSLQEVEKNYIQLKQFKHIRLCGLMAILPKDAPPNTLMQYARQMRKLLDKLKLQNNDSAFCHLSMGMSNDYTICLEAGSNMLRLGTAIFGKRDT